METPSVPTPPDIRKPKELPNLDDELGVSLTEGSTLPPVELPLLLEFPAHEGGVFSDSVNMPLNSLGGDYADYTPSQIHDLNQQLLDDSVPQRPLIDEVRPMSVLRLEYENGKESFVKQIDWLIKNGFDSIRRTRGILLSRTIADDVNPFYVQEMETVSTDNVALAFAYLESLIDSPDSEFAVARTLSLLESTMKILDEAGIDKLVYEDFYDEFVKLVCHTIEPVLDTVALKKAALLLAFQNLEISNAIVIYLRFLTSAQIRLHREEYEGFVVHPDTQELMDVDSFCNNIVQSMGKEADNVEIQVLCRALNLNVDVAYLDGSKSDGVDFIKFRCDSIEQTAPLVLLYRPGHYDILR